MPRPRGRDVISHPDGGWEVAEPGGERASARRNTQAYAIDRVREILDGRYDSEIVIHRPDGQIRDSDVVAPGNNPHPSRDWN